MSGPNLPQLRLVRGLSVEDGAGVSIPGGCLLLEYERGRSCLLAVGRADEVLAHPAAAGARVVNRPRSVLVPGLVNAHTHLDLTHVGPRPHDPEDGFVSFGMLVGRERRTDPAAIAESVRRGIEMSLAGGTVAVGDIAGCPRGRLTLEPLRELRASAIGGVSYLEFFGIGRHESPAAERLEAWLAAVDWREDRGVRAGLGPHAPYSVSARLYERAAAFAAVHAVPVATHLAEHEEERLFVAHGRGPAREFLASVGAWEDAVLRDVGRGLTPVRHLEGVLRARPFVVAHVNDAGDDEIETLARARASVAYCPRASAYFANERRFGPHRYREMLAAGVNVALGTDSIINTGGNDGAGLGSLSVLDEMRVLVRRDGTDARTLLRMATLNGAEALGLDPGAFRFVRGGSPAGIAAIDVPERPASREFLEQAMLSSGGVELLHVEKAGAGGVDGCIATSGGV